MIKLTLRSKITIRPISFEYWRVFGTLKHDAKLALILNQFVTLIMQRYSNATLSTAALALECSTKFALFSRRLVTLELGKNSTAS